MTNNQKGKTRLTSVRMAESTIGNKFKELGKVQKLKQRIQNKHRKKAKLRPQQKEFKTVIQQKLSLKNQEDLMEEGAKKYQHWSGKEEQPKQIKRKL